jgi:hypothetical protein
LYNIQLGRTIHSTPLFSSLINSAKHHKTRRRDEQSQFGSSYPLLGKTLDTNKIVTPCWIMYLSVVVSFFFFDLIVMGRKKKNEYYTHTKKKKKQGTKIKKVGTRRS